MRYGATQAVWKRHSNKMTSEASGKNVKEITENENESSENSE